MAWCARRISRRNVADRNIRRQRGIAQCFPERVLRWCQCISFFVSGVLMLPPFYCKAVSDDGLFASYAEVIQLVADSRLRIYRYTIAKVSPVPIPLALS